MADDRLIKLIKDELEVMESLIEKWSFNSDDYSLGKIRGLKKGVSFLEFLIYFLEKESRRESKSD